MLVSAMFLVRKAVTLAAFRGVGLRPATSRAENIEQEDHLHLLTSIEALYS
jgi:hypothetical protein